MTRDDIIRMAREANCTTPGQVFQFTIEELERFAALVAAAMLGSQARWEGVLVNRDDIIKLAESKGYSAKPCASENLMMVKIGKADNANERMKLTADGQVLVVDECHYWQVGTVDEWAEYLQEKQT